MPNRQRELEKLLKELGASFIGFSNIDGKEAADFQGLHNAVTIGIRLSDAIIDQIDDKPTYTYFHHYRTVNALLDQITLRGVLFLQEMGYSAVAVPASQTVNDKADPYCAIFPHKTAAVMAGLGRIGKNGLFLHKEYGPRVRLATILTDMELVTDGQAAENGHDGIIDNRGCVSERVVDSDNGGSIERLSLDRCGSCNRCVNACPAMALTGKEWYPGAARDEIVDAKACSDYMNQKFKHIGRGSVCGICIRVCPYKKTTNK
jgi:epoxyqueuosine reductase